MHAQLKTPFERSNTPSIERTAPSSETALTTKWMSWNELPWLQQQDGFGPALKLCDRIAQSVVTSGSTGAFMNAALHELAAEFSVQWAGVVERFPQWNQRAEFGRKPFAAWPGRLFEEAFDRNAGVVADLNDTSGTVAAIVPLEGTSTDPLLLMLAGRRIPAAELPSILMAARALSQGMQLAQRVEQQGRLNERLRETLRVASRLSQIFETVPLLEAIAQEATRMLDCDRASIFIWDRPNQKLLACPALGVEGRTLYLPDNAGIVGTVVQTGQMIRVDDAYNDKRFDQSVDKKSGYRTRNLLCVPLLDSNGKLIGAFEGINKNRGTFDTDDDDILTQLGIQAAVALRNTREREMLLRTHQQLTEQLHGGVRIVGNSPAIKALRQTIERLSGTELPVLILGESGTGKEVVAQSLHLRGPRSGNPFVAVNCAALTESLLESELFGHEKGAFTDARETHKGKFELADGGTIFLDEIGDMSAGGQAKLLRVLEQRIITRVGGTQPIHVDVRIVAATNINLAEAVRQKKFREDLYYRLSVVTLDLPPLRNRGEDIVPLAEYFLRQFCPKARRAVLELSSEAQRRLTTHGWPGNVRELRNLMERVAFLSTGDKVEAEDLAFILSPIHEDAEAPLGVDLGLMKATYRFQEQYISRAAKLAKGNMSEVARMLGLHRSNLYRKMKQLGMDVPDE